MNAPDVIVIINYRALPDHEEKALKMLTDLVAVVRAAEPDCKGITVIKGASDPGTFMLIETWTSREAYLGPHMLTPHIRAFKERAGDFMDGPPGITFWQTACAV